ncbi:hypothetical protein NAEGRDRAFT_82638 [Naegleria gruberi]|uniref:DUF1304 domain-containing protein n=1 Tax=Naegleria gruberi TaxID=5762 RepID=D2VHT0_NAEGR|nr:uncharacterized protein NAEGRDRAFT_82638 [Naegleria gruberi]EFC43727.1 hypothetical protein NAEGRDRAFT_82638 [Naegleria gruberi]|eukprot:XP_002676471.1 hypothetical protein NAEGRDRAFT_82638 [Naegleria gruberi strain NEG-M]
MSSLIPQCLVGGVGLLHFYIMALEMFMWNTPRGRKAFNLTETFAEQTKVLAANQGLYNGFLGAGLVWSLFSKSFNYELQMFFLSCVGVAGLFGAATASRKILFVQTIPAVIAMLAVNFL